MKTSIWDSVYPPEPPIYGWTRSGQPIRKLVTEPVDESLDAWLARFERKLDAQRRKRAESQSVAHGLEFQKKVKDGKHDDFWDDSPEPLPPLTEAEAKEALAAATAYLQRAVAHPEDYQPPKAPKTPQRPPEELLAEWEAQIAGWHKRRPRRQSKFFQ